MTDEPQDHGWRAHLDLAHAAPRCGARRNRDGKPCCQPAMPNGRCRVHGGSAPALPLKTPEDCALAYADLLDDVGAGRLTPEEAQTISAIVSKRAELFGTIELASEIDTLKAQLAAVVGTQRAPSPIRRPFAIT